MALTTKHTNRFNSFGVVSLEYIYIYIHYGVLDEFSNEIRTMCFSSNTASNAQKVDVQNAFCLVSLDSRVTHMPAIIFNVLIFQIKKLIHFLQRLRKNRFSSNYENNFCFTFSSQVSARKVNERPFICYFNSAQSIPMLRE